MIFFQGETIDLDPELKEACGDSVKEFCKDRQSGHAQVSI